MAGELDYAMEVIAEVNDGGNDAESDGDTSDPSQVRGVAHQAHAGRCQQL